MLERSIMADGVQILRRNRPGTKAIVSILVPVPSTYIHSKYSSSPEHTENSSYFKDSDCSRCTQLQRPVKCLTPRLKFNPQIRGLSLPYCKKLPVKKTLTLLPLAQPARLLPNVLPLWETSVNSCIYV